MDIPATTFNTLFMRRIETQEGREKIAEVGGAYIKDRLREVSFMGKIIPFRDITRAELQVSVNHDCLVKIEEIEPETRAMALTFRGRPTARYLEAKRAETPFWMVASEKFEKTEQELQAYTMPVTEVIEKNSLADMQETRDLYFLRYAQLAVEGFYGTRDGATDGLYSTSADPHPATDETTPRGNVVKGCADANNSDTDAFEFFRTGATGQNTGVTSTSNVDQRGEYNSKVVRSDLVKLFQRIDGRRRLKAETLLMSEYDFDDILTWGLEEFGDKLTSEVVVDGYKYNTLLSKKLVRSIKNDILRPGNIWCFASADCLGRAYILNKVKFFVKKEFNLIQWMAWEDIGASIINLAAVAKLELYDGNPFVGTFYRPMAEDDLGGSNIVTDSTGAVKHYPNIVQY